MLEVPPREIIKYPDSRLRQVSESIGSIDDQVRCLAADMLETMKEGNGAGLAAIQVGEPVRLFVISAETAGTSESMVFLNPVIKPILPEAESADEGCLSFPGIFVPVRRAMRVIVEAKGLDGTLFQREATGFFARAVQHELEHLDGRLLIDHLGPVRRRMIKAKLAKAKRRQDD